jgi:hypothetical protein
MASSLFDSQKFADLRELLGELDELHSTLPSRFNRTLFGRVRRLTGSQSDWAGLTGVTQSTIGNWERGYTSPNRTYRRDLQRATASMRGIIVQRYTGGRRETSIDIVVTERHLRNSILRAALTDFEYDIEAGKIVPVPFAGDLDDTQVNEIIQDRQNLIESLREQSKIIRESISDSANINEKKFLTYLEGYEKECKKDKPNPRLLNRLGSLINRGTNNEDIRLALNSWDSEAIDGFNRDHIELMRLYFREALAKAQEIDGTEVQDVVTVSDGIEFREVAAIMESAATNEGSPIIDRSIPTLLKDIANEVRDLSDAATFTTDERRKEVLQRRKSEAFKNGSVYVGRFVFFAALVSSLVLPGAFEVLGVLGTIVGIAEAFSPGTIRSHYEKLREKFPALPNLPTAGSDDNEK